MKNRVSTFRQELGLSQVEFAKVLRVSRQTVSAIENGKYNPSLDLAFEIAYFFQKPIEEIFLYERIAPDEKSNCLLGVAFVAVGLAAFLLALQVGPRMEGILVAAGGAMLASASSSWRNFSIGMPL